MITHNIMIFFFELFLGISWQYFFLGGLGTFHGMLNSFVHVVMYSYYAIAALGPAYQKYLWWKKYLTVFQMVRLETVVA